MTEPNKEGTFVLYTDRYGTVERKEVEKLVRYYQESLEENKALQSRIAELESANAMFKKHLSDCSARLQKANEQLEKYRQYCERNNLQGL